MGIPVRFATSAPSLDHLSVNDFRLGIKTGSAYAPTSTSLFWASISPPADGYTLYLDKGQTYGAQGPSIYVLDNDKGLQSFLEDHLNYGGGSLSSSQEGIHSASLEEGICIINKEPEPFHCDDIWAFYDAGFSPSLASGSLSNTNWFNRGTLQSTFISGSFGSAASWNSSGSGSVILTGASNSYSNLGWGVTNKLYSPFGIAMWFYDNSASDRSIPIGKDDQVASDGIWVEKIATGGDPYFSVTVAGEVTNFNTVTYTEGAWHYVVFNFGNTQNQISIDGSTLGSRSRTSLLSALTAAKNFYVGTKNGTTNLFNGRVSRIAFREGGWTQSEIDDDFSALRGRYGV